ncbi:MAG: hypothetical protein HY696_11715 [Deltaproteobacteria bacterium]|nr:hypothetical protein [Deltaproteobacteria bacterium]
MAQTDNAAPDFVLGAQSIWTGLIGAGVLLLGMIGLHVGTRLQVLPSGPPHPRFIVLLFIAVAAMATYEFLVVKVHRRHFDWSVSRALDAAAWRRVWLRWITMTGCLMLAWGTYAALREYHLHIGLPFLVEYAKSYYRPFFELFTVATALLLLGAFPYLLLCERRGRWRNEDDDLLIIARGAQALWRRQAPAPGFARVLRGYLVKFYFIPLMTVFWVNNAASFDRNLGGLFQPNLWHGFSVPQMNRLYTAAYEGIMFLDVSLALVGYVCTWRLLDSHLRSAEPTIAGWLVALLCYPPFARISDSYLAYNSGNHFWGQTLAATPILYALFAVLILGCMWIYVHATIAFGFRFSNLTHRGILSSGPYAIIRHPAYVAKNLSWWLITIPFLFSLGDCLRLFGWNLLYLGRALTEERHLRQFPDYRAYMQKVRWRFIPGVF